MAIKSAKSTAKPIAADNIVILSRKKETSGAVVFEEAEIPGQPLSIRSLYIKRYVAGNAQTAGVQVDKTGTAPVGELARRFTVDKECKGSRRYAEEEIAGKPPIIGNVYIERHLVSDVQAVVLTLLLKSEPLAKAA